MAALSQRQGAGEASRGAAPSSKPNTAHKILLLGPRRAGKSSLCKVVYQSFQPNDTLFLAPTTRIQKHQVKTFQRLEIWDVPGSALQDLAPNTFGAGPTSATGDSGLDIPWAEADAIIFVVDAQDDYFDALSKLNQVILLGYRSNPDIHFHVFINKVDGLSDDYKYDTQRDIEQRVHEELIDSSHEFQDPSSTEPFRLEAEVKLRFHLTSVFESSVFVAFSRIQQRLMQDERKMEATPEEPESGQEDEQDKPPEERISLHDAVEQACNLLCSSCSLEKAYIFDVPSRTFVGCDTSPFDLPLFDVMFQYTKFLTEFSDLYMASTADTAKPMRTWSASVVRLGSDTSVAFWQLNRYVHTLTQPSRALCHSAHKYLRLQPRHSGTLTTPADSTGLQHRALPHNDRSARTPCGPIVT